MEQNVRYWIKRRKPLDPALRQIDPVKFHILFSLECVLLWTGCLSQLWPDKDWMSRKLGLDCWQWKDISLLHRMDTGFGNNLNFYGTGRSVEYSGRWAHTTTDLEQQTFYECAETYNSRPVVGFRLPPRSRWKLCSSGLLRRE